MKSEWTGKKEKRQKKDRRGEEGKTVQMERTRNDHGVPHSHAITLRPEDGQWLLPSRMACSLPWHSDDSVRLPRDQPIPRRLVLMHSTSWARGFTHKWGQPRQRCTQPVVRRLPSWLDVVCSSSRSWERLFHLVGHDVSVTLCSVPDESPLYPVMPLVERDGPPLGLFIQRSGVDRAQIFHEWRAELAGKDRQTEVFLFVVLVSRRRRANI